MNLTSFVFHFYLSSVDRIQTVKKDDKFSSHVEMDDLERERDLVHGSLEHLESSVSQLSKTTLNNFC